MEKCVQYHGTPCKCNNEKAFAKFHFVDSSNQDLHHHKDRVRVQRPAQEGEVVPGAGGGGGAREEHSPRPHLRPWLPRLQHGALPRPGRAAVR